MFAALLFSHAQPDAAQGGKEEAGGGKKGGKGKIIPAARQLPWSEA